MPPLGFKCELTEREDSSTFKEVNSDCVREKAARGSSGEWMFLLTGRRLAAAEARGEEVAGRMIRRKREGEKELR